MKSCITGDVIRFALACRHFLAPSQEVKPLVERTVSELPLRASHMRFSVLYCITLHSSHDCVVALYVLFLFASAACSPVSCIVPARPYLRGQKSIPPLLRQLVRPQRSRVPYRAEPACPFEVERVQSGVSYNSSIASARPVAPQLENGKSSPEATCMKRQKSFTSSSAISQEK